MIQKVLFLVGVLMLTACSVVYEQDTRSTKTEWTDTQLSMEIAGIVNKAPFRGETRINTAIYDGKALLVGQAKTELLRQSLVDKIRALNGIETIYNQIRIKEPLSLTDVSKDAWLTTRVKSAFIASKKLRNVNIKVITEDSEVFLLGYVTRKQSNDATEITRNISGVKQVIKGFQYH